MLDLSATQALVPVEFARSAQDGPHRAFARSPAGAAGQAAMNDARMAAELGATRCGQHTAQRRAVDLASRP